METDVRVGLWSGVQPTCFDFAQTVSRSDCERQLLNHPCRPGVPGVLICSLTLLTPLPAERDIKVVRPLYSVEVTETETAKFETEISEEDLHATWKLKEETLHPSAVRSHSDDTAEK